MADSYGEEAVIEILQRRDGLSLSEAQALLDECIEMVDGGEDPEEVCADELGLEPDYIWALIR